MTSIEVVAARAQARIAHHEAGHAVAAVARGGRLIRIHLGHADWSTLDLSGDEPGEACYRITWAAQPFVTFAGPYAEAIWTVEHEPDVDDLDEAMGYAWDNNSDGDTAKYEGRVDVLTDAAAQLGFPVVGRAWEWEWRDELEELWPAIGEVASSLIDGQPVTHDTVASAIQRIDLS